MNSFGQARRDTASKESSALAGNSGDPGLCLCKAVTSSVVHPVCKPGRYKCSLNLENKKITLKIMQCSNNAVKKRGGTVF